VGLSRSSTGRRGPGIIVQQEVFGLNRQIRGICDLLAEEGYVVMAPDLFARLERDVDLGYTPTEFEKAVALHARFDDELGLTDVGAAIAALRAMPEVAGGIGTIGFCLGGRMAVKTAACHEVDCAVSYYGVGIEDCLRGGQPDARG
jgi:carboxymethylenebutenolidase